MRAYLHVCPSMLARSTLTGEDGSPFLPLGGLSNNLLIALDGSDVVTQRLASRQDEIDSSLELFVSNLLATKEQPARTATPVNFRDFLLLTQFRTALGLTCGFDRRRFQLVCDFDDELLAQFASILDTAAKRVKEWDGRVGFVYLPGAERYSSWIANIDADGSRSAVLRVVDELALDRVDVHEVFLRHAAPETLFHGHYTEEGYAMVADAILTRLRD